MSSNHQNPESSSRKFTNVHSNVYQILGQSDRSSVSLELEKESLNESLFKNSRVLKLGEFEELSFINISDPELSVFSDNEVKNPCSSNNNNNPVEHLKESLTELKSLHSRLRFLLKDLEDCLDE